MERKIIKTDDGSVTIHLPEWDEQYHSRHGAVQEARHVFLKMGLHYYVEQQKPENISILEIGFGTGLNAFLTFLEAENLKIPVDYTGVEAYPVTPEEIEQLNYAVVSGAENQEKIFHKMHHIPWEQKESLSEFFKLRKQQQKFSEITDQNAYNLIYFDAFGARVQPELWTEAIFKLMYNALLPNGVLVTYSAKGSVRRGMLACGFLVERLPGPPGKREMLRAVKNDLSAS